MGASISNARASTKVGPTLARDELLLIAKGAHLDGLDRPALSSGLQVGADQTGSKHPGDSRNRGKRGQPVWPITTQDRQGPRMGPPLAICETRTVQDG